MYKLPVLALGLLLCLFLFSSPVLGFDGDTLFFDDFNDGKIDDWTIEAGHWSVDGGNLLANESGVLSFLGEVHNGNTQWDNYRIELDVNNVSGVDNGIEFRKNGNTHYTFNLRHGTGAFATPEIKLWKTVDGVDTLIASTHSQELLNNVWYHLKIEVFNENIKLWVNETQVFDYLDTNTEIKKGNIGLESWTGAVGSITIRFDNIKITSINPSLPRIPVIFIPGIGGSEMKTSQDIIWSSEDGHGGTFSHAYSSGEKVWVNQDEASKLGEDDYFDILKLKPDGQTSEASLSLTGNLTSFGYSDIDSFFQGLGYTKGTNFFIFPYDWRKDVRSSQADLDSLIENAKTLSGQSKVNLVVHSLGGLIARNYISDPGKAGKVNLLIELGVPHLGAISAAKTLIYGQALQRNVFGIIPVGIPASEIKDVLQNSTGLLQLLPSNQYYSFYNNSDKDHPYPFRDDRDIDSNNTTGDLNYDQTKNLFSNLSYNMTVFNLAEQFHTSIDPVLSHTNGVKIHEIVGSSQPTLGQIQETWWITWPINLIPKQDEIFINGDDTVPLYSASLKSDSQDLSGAYKIYYVEQKHSDLVSQNGTAMETVKSILQSDTLPVEVKDQKISLEGTQVSVDDASLDLYDEDGNHTGLNSNGDVETNIPDSFYDSLGKTKHVFVKKKAAKKPKAKITSSKEAKIKIKIRTYSQDKIIKTILYKDVPINPDIPIEFTIDPTSQIAPTLSSGSETISATSEVSDSAALDQTSPKTTFQISGTKNSSGIYDGPVTITLTGEDSGAGILRIEYSLDNGQTVQTYNKPFTISNPGKTTIQFKSIDKVGNEEIPQTITIEITQPFSTSNPSNSSNSSNSESGTSLTATNITLTSLTSPISLNPSLSSTTEVLGISFKNPEDLTKSVEQISTLTPSVNSESLDSARDKLLTNNSPIDPRLSGLLIVSAITIGGASLLLGASFLHPVPK